MAGLLDGKPARGIRLGRQSLDTAPVTGMICVSLASACARPTVTPYSALGGGSRACERVFDKYG